MLSLALEQSITVSELRSEMVGGHGEVQDCFQTGREKARSAMSRVVLPECFEIKFVRVARRDNTVGETFGSVAVSHVGSTLL